MLFRSKLYEAAADLATGQKGINAVYEEEAQPATSKIAERNRVRQVDDVVAEFSAAMRQSMVNLTQEVKEARRGRVEGGIEESDNYEEEPLGQQPRPRLRRRRRGCTAYTYCPPNPDSGDAV